jgi:uncharacterized protein YjbK
VMSRWIESELKLLLPGEAAAQRIREALGPGRVAVQANHFFDRPDGALAGARIAVRLRSEDERYRLTLKGDELESPGGALSRRIELETDVTRAEFEAGRDGGLELLAWLDRFESQAEVEGRPAELARFLASLRSLCRGVRLVRQGSFTNRRERLRAELRDEEGRFEVLLDLDETRFPGDRTADYEIEVELDREGGPAADSPPRRSPRQVELALREWLRALADIEVTPASSKLSRLHARIGRPR